MSAPRSRIAGARASSARDLVPLGLAFAAIAVRVLAWLRFDALTYDGTYYLRQAERILHGRYDWVGFPPGYPFAVALLELPLRDAVLAGRIVSLLAGLGSIVLAYRLARRHLGPTPAWIATLFLAVHPHLARVQVETLSESLYLLLLLAGILWWETRRDLRAGLALGAAFLVRPEAIFVLGGLLLGRAARDRRWPLALTVGLVPVAAFAVLASLAVGHPVLSPKQGQMDLGPGILERAWLLVLTVHANFPLLLLPGACAWGVRRAPHLLLPIAPLVLLPFFAIHLQDRIATPAVPFLAILGVGWITTLVPQRQRIAAAVAGLTFALGAGPGVLNFWRSPPLTPHARDIGTALRSHLAPSDRVAGRFPFVAYYAGAEFVRAPRELGYDALLDSLQAVGATHVVVLEGEVGNILPQLRPLFEDARLTESDGRVEPVAWVDSPPGARAILYRFLPPAVPIAPPLRSGVRAAAWTPDGWLAATTGGALVRIAPPESLAAPGEVQDLATDATGTRLVVLVGPPGREHLAVRRAGGWIDLPSTQSEEPVSPTWIGDELLYVRRRAPAGLRRLDPQTGRVQPVALAGLKPSVATPYAVAARAAEVAITYRMEVGGHWVLAVATWPASASAADTLELTGRWASQLRLGDPRIEWVPGEDAVLATVAVVRADGILSAEHTSLCVARTEGRLRRLTFGLDRPRRPVPGGGALAYLAGEDDLHLAPAPFAHLRRDPVRVFAPAAAAAR